MQTALKHSCWRLRIFKVELIGGLLLYAIELFKSEIVFLCYLSLYEIRRLGRFYLLSFLLWEEVQHLWRATNRNNAINFILMELIQGNHLIFERCQIAISMKLSVSLDFCNSNLNLRSCLYKLWHYSQVEPYSLLMMESQSCYFSN